MAQKLKLKKKKKGNSGSIIMEGSLGKITKLPTNFQHVGGKVCHEKQDFAQKVSFLGGVLRQERRALKEN